MQDKDEQARLRKHFNDAPGQGHIAEEAMGVWENAHAYGNDSEILRAESTLASLGYDTPEQRADAARARREHAERAAREAERVKENRGPAAARDDHAGGPVEQHAGVVDEHGGPLGLDEGKGEGKDAKAARRQPPAGRTSPAGKQATAGKPGKGAA